MRNSRRDGSHVTLVTKGDFSGILLPVFPVVVQDPQVEEQHQGEREHGGGDQPEPQGVVRDVERVLPQARVGKVDLVGSRLLHQLDLEEPGAVNDDGDAEDGGDVVPTPSYQEVGLGVADAQEALQCYCAACVCRSCKSNWYTAIKSWTHVDENIKRHEAVFCTSLRCFRNKSPKGLLSSVSHVQRPDYLTIYSRRLPGENCAIQIVNECGSIFFAIYGFHLYNLMRTKV